MPRKKLTPQQAKALLMADGMDFQEDFHALGSSAVQALADTAKLAGYRKSKSAPGSTVRMFYQYLSRVAPVVHAPGQLTQAERRAYQARGRRAHSTKKSPAQLNREIVEALASKHKSTTRAHATVKTYDAPKPDMTARQINAIVRAADGRNIYLIRTRLDEETVQRVTSARTKGRETEVRSLATGNWIPVLPERGDSLEVR